MIRALTARPIRSVSQYLLLHESNPLSKCLTGRSCVPKQSEGNYLTLWETVYIIFQNKFILPVEKHETFKSKRQMKTVYQHFPTKNLAWILPFTQDNTWICPFFHLNTIQNLSSVCPQNFDHKSDITSKVKKELSVNLLQWSHYARNIIVSLFVIHPHITSKFWHLSHHIVFY